MLVTVYAPPSVYGLELAAVSAIFAAANQITRLPPAYQVRIVAVEAGPQHARSGLTIQPDMTMAECDTPGDLLIVAPSASWSQPQPADVVDWLQRQATAARYGSIGNGAFLLGAAGLLDGRRVTTHWECSNELARTFPAAMLERDRIFVRDGAMFSAAGGIAAIDMMLSLIEEDHGREVTLRLTRQFVMFMQRSGAQAQVSVTLATQGATRDPIQQVQHHVRDNLAGNLSVGALADIAAMSPRNFARVFLAETGMRPADFVEQTRVNLAKQMLETTALSAQQVARRCGFSSSEAARRAFRRRTGDTMARYRMGLAGGGEA